MSSLQQEHRFTLSVLLGMLCAFILVGWLWTKMRNAPTLPAPSLPPPSAQEPSPVMCTMEAKQCPDGSYVGRVPPRCEFAPCPR